MEGTLSIAGVSKYKSMRDKLASRIIGQSDAIEPIVRCVEMHKVGLNPENRPIGIFLLLGPTGTGKTKTVEALAGVLHGNEKNVLRIDCGEFQQEHEVAKLIGAPPGYLGHKETEARLCQRHLNAATSYDCGISIVLFDEIEKAAPSFHRILLGILDKGKLMLGEGKSVNFENSIIFMTSNLGATGMQDALQPSYGFGKDAPGNVQGKLSSIGAHAVKKHFPPEFVNRLDHIITYKPLNNESLVKILDLELEALQAHFDKRLDTRTFRIDVKPAAKEFLLKNGTSPLYGARELKRLLTKTITQPIASLLLGYQIEPGSLVIVDLAQDGNSIHIQPTFRNTIYIKPRKTRNTVARSVNKEEVTADTPIYTPPQTD